MDKEKISVCSLIDAEKTYGKNHRVLGPLSLTVHSGEILGVRGFNGAGKSTLLKLLAGVVKPDGGAVTLSPETKGKIGYVPQDIALYEELTGLDNLKFWGRVCGMRKNEINDRSSWLLERVQLTSKAGERVAGYSGGMKRRLHLITALMGSPNLLLLDEPTVGADRQSVKLIISTLQHFAELGCAVVIISHHEGELESVSHRIITMDKGILEKEEENEL